MHWACAGADCALWRMLAKRATHPWARKRAWGSVRVPIPVPKTVQPVLEWEPFLFKMVVPILKQCLGLGCHRIYHFEMEVFRLEMGYFCFPGPKTVWVQTLFRFQNGMYCFVMV